MIKGKEEDKPRLPGVLPSNARTNAAEAGVQGWGWENRTWDFGKPAADVAAAKAPEAAPAKEATEGAAPAAPAAPAEAAAKPAAAL